MNTPHLEIPAEVREFAEKSVDQARKAFESFVAAAQKASAQSEAAAELMAASAKEVGSKAIGFAEANVKAAFDLAEKTRPRQGSQGNSLDPVRISEDPGRGRAGAGQNDRRGREESRHPHDGIEIMPQGPRKTKAAPPPPRRLSPRRPSLRSRGARRARG